MKQPQRQSVRRTLANARAIAAERQEIIVRVSMLQEAIELADEELRQLLPDDGIRQQIEAICEAKGRAAVRPRVALDDFAKYNHVI